MNKRRFTNVPPASFLSKVAFSFRRVKSKDRWALINLFALGASLAGAISWAIGEGSLLFLVTLAMVLVNQCAYAICEWRGFVWFLRGRDWKQTHEHIIGVGVVERAREVR